jgi:hypothetical protein
VAGNESRRSVRSSFANAEILPGRCNLPLPGGMASSTSTILPQGQWQSGVLKYSPPGLAFTAQPRQKPPPPSPAGRQQSSKWTSTLLCLLFSTTVSTSSIGFIHFVLSKVRTKQGNGPLTHINNCNFRRSLNLSGPGLKNRIAAFRPGLISLPPRNKDVGLWQQPTKKGIHALFFFNIRLDAV